MKTISAILVVAALAACGSSKPADAPAVGQCDGQSRPQLDCSSEVKYQGTNVDGGFTLAGIGGAKGSVEQKALRDIDKETASYIAEARRLCDEYNKCVLDKDTYATRSENMRRRMAQVPELLDGFKGAQDDDARRAALEKAYRTIVPDDQRTELQLDFSVLAQRPNEVAPSPLAANATVSTGSHLAFVVHVSRPAYVYVFQKSSKGAVVVLFPDPRITIQNPVASASDLRIPQGGASFKLDDADIGAEGVYVVASLHPVTQLAAAAEQARTGAAPTAPINQVTSIDSGCKSRGLSFENDAPTAGSCVRSRGLSFDDGTPAAGAKPSIAATTEAADDLIATVFRFQHTH
jgi:hypothetical protein